MSRTQSKKRHRRRKEFAHAKGVRPLRADERPLTQPCTVVPLHPNGVPRTDQQVPGVIFAGSARGLHVRLEADVPLSSGSAIALGADVGHVGTQFTSLRVETIERGREQVLLEASFGGLLQKILDVEYYCPELCRETLDFRFPFDETLLCRLAQVGIVSRICLDRIQVCPRCGGLPTFRLGCGSCLSARTEAELLIHHYACAHVGTVDEFDQAGTIACPKCHARRLVVGADFEHLPGPHHCQDCGWTGTELTQIGRCLLCASRFKSDDASIRELFGYRTNRLDVRALVP